MNYVVYQNAFWNRDLSTIDPQWWGRGERTQATRIPEMHEELLKNTGNTKNSCMFEICLLTSALGPKKPIRQNRIFLTELGNNFFAWPCTPLQSFAGALQQHEHGMVQSSNMKGTSGGVTTSSSTLSGGGARLPRSCKGLKWKWDMSAWVREKETPPYLIKIRHAFVRGLTELCLIIDHFSDYFMHGTCMYVFVIHL